METTDPIDVGAPNTRAISAWHRFALRTTYVSGDTVPPTRLSPSPQLVVTTASFRAPLIRL